MEGHPMNKKSWESLSSTFSNLEISLSRDSCYASDEVSIASTKPTSANTSIISSLGPSSETTFRPLLKSILKRPYSDFEEDEVSESGYASEGSGYEHDTIFEESDGDMCDIPIWDDTSDIMSEYCGEDIESFDGSFISFESMVRFDTNILYIEAPEPVEDDIGAGMTCHEMMEMARPSCTSDEIQEEKYSAPDIDCEDSNHEAISDSIEQLPEHTSDILDLDKRLFVAYMNGINGIANPEYRSRLRARVDDFRSGRVSSPFLDLDSANAVYLDQVLNHVIGTFRNIVVKDEFDELLALRDDNSHLKQQEGATRISSPTIFDKIEHLLFERLTSEDVSVGPDEMRFFASGVAYALENWRCYAPC